METKKYRKTKLHRKKKEPDLFEELRLGLQLGVHVGTCVQKQRCRLSVASPSGEHEGGAARVGHGVYIVALREQDLARVCSALGVTTRKNNRRHSKEWRGETVRGGKQIEIQQPWTLISAVPLSDHDNRTKVGPRTMPRCCTILLTALCRTSKFVTRDYHRSELGHRTDGGPRLY